MKIAVFGWYGHNNTGDERIKYCLNNFLLSLGGIQTIDFYDLHENGVKGKTDRFNEYDLVIIGGGGLILSQANYHDFINSIDTNIITLGISVERTALTGNAKKFAKALLNKSKGFLVRDLSSKQKLFKYDLQKKVKVSSDLTFLEPYSAVSTVVNNKTIGINLLPKPAWFNYSTLNTPIFAFLLRQLNRFGLEDFIKVKNYKKLIGVLKNQFELLPIPFYCASSQKSMSLYHQSDIEFLKNYFPQVPHTFVDQDLDKCKIFMCMRLHAAIFAVQKGVPVICLPYLPKNKNFMKEVGLDELVVNEDQVDNVLTTIDYINDNIDLIRKKMLTYKEQAMVKIKKDIVDLLNSVK